MATKQMDKFSHAIPLRISKYEFQAMFDSQKVAVQVYKESLAAASVNERRKLIKVPEFETVEEFTTTAMTNLATVSHGDIVLTNAEGIEVSRVKANYQQPIAYKRD